MSGRAVVFVLGNLLMVIGACLLAPLGVAIFYGEPSVGRANEIAAFGGVMAGCLSFGYLARRFLRPWADKVRLREGFAIVTFSWVLITVVGALPYLLIGTCGTVTDAFFETMSGFTTTGATILTDLSIVPPSVHVWRCMTQWLGGMGVVVLSIALLPILGQGGYRLLKAETPGGVAYERERPRITDAAKDLWRLYVLISLAEFVLLLVSGMSVFDAVCHTFTTMSTGGFSPHNESMGYFSSPFTQWIVTVFMFIAGANFAVHAAVLRGNWREPRKNPEFRLYAGVVAVATVLGFVTLAPTLGMNEKTLREAAFQVVSIVTTTGYGTADFDAWPHFMRLLLVVLMFVGGCMGSTAGGMKVARLIVYVKSLLRELHNLIYPHAIRPLRVGRRVLEPEIVSNIMAFGMVYVTGFAFGALVLTAYGYDLVTAASAAASAIGNVGPGLSQVGPTVNWAHMPALAKWLMSFLMLVGRLEVYSVLILLTPWVWKR